MRDQILQNTRRVLVFVIALAALALGQARANAQVDATLPAHTTVVVFADHPMQAEAWTALFEAMRAAVSEDKIMGLDENPQFVRGDAIRPGLMIGDSIVVYLHGDCRLEPLPRRTAYSVPLGWVRRENGQIAPYIHVDCTRIGQVIGPQAQGLDENHRSLMMAGAMARVVVHEWIHIARQSAEHGRAGITKAQFGEADLLGETETRGARR